MQGRFVNPAGTCAVASELLRRDIDAKVHRTGAAELVIEAESGARVLVHVAAKQHDLWPRIELPRDTNGRDLLVLVDFEHKSQTDRADFYVLDNNEWHSLAETASEACYMSGDTMLCNLQPQHVAPYKEKWAKIGVEKKP